MLGQDWSLFLCRKSMFKFFDTHLYYSTTVTILLYSICNVVTSLINILRVTASRSQPLLYYLPVYIMTAFAIVHLHVMSRLRTCMWCSVGLLVRIELPRSALPPLPRHLPYVAGGGVPRGARWASTHCRTKNRHRLVAPGTLKNCFSDWGSC